MEQFGSTAAEWVILGLILINLALIRRSLAREDRRQRILNRFFNGRKSY